MNVLIAKDNIGDFFLLKSAVKEAGINCHINMISISGISFAHIRKLDETPVSDFIVVGISLLKDEGLKVLKEI